MEINGIKKISTLNGEVTTVVSNCIMVPEIIKTVLSNAITYSGTHSVSYVAIDPATGEKLIAEGSPKHMNINSLDKTKALSNGMTLGDFLELQKEVVIKFVSGDFDLPVVEPTTVSEPVE